MLSSQIAASLLPKTAWVAIVVLSVALLAVASLQPGLTAFADPAFRLGVATVDTGGASISGYYVVLTQGGSFVGSGFSPTEFFLNGGQEYVVSVADYGDYVFDHWQDTGSSGRDRAITLNSDANLVAVYRNVNGGPSSPPSDQPPASTQSTVTIRTVDSTGSEIPGYYVVLSKDGSVIATGFSPAQFTLVDGQQYVVSVSDYGSYHFDHWQDSGSQSRERTITTSSSEYVAVYSTDQASPPPDETNPPDDEQPPVSGQSVLTVRTQAGSEISGYWTVLSQNGATVATGFSPAQFTLNNGQDYVVSVSDYGDYAFHHWQDTGSATRDRSISLTGDTEIIAVYTGPNSDVPDDQTPPPDEDPQDPPVSGQSTITVSTTSSTGAISGYYVTLSQNGAVLESGFSPEQFTVNNGQDYTISVSDYGNYAFDHWDDTGSQSRDRSISVTQDTQFTAVYRNINTNTNPNPPPPPPSGTPGSITVYAYRIASPWWGPTFSGAGANMFFTLYDSNMAVVATGFADENGHTFTGLNSGQTYYVYPADCDGCHNTNHDVKFRHWENGSTERPRAVIAGSAGVGAYFEYVPWT